MPEEFDPWPGESAGRLRRALDRSGLSVAALAERTGYSRATWESYLDGRRPVPRGALLALARVTGTQAPRGPGRPPDAPDARDTPDTPAPDTPAADVTPDAAPETTAAAFPQSRGAHRDGGHRNRVAVAAGVVGAVLVVAAAVLLTGLGGDDGDEGLVARPQPATSAPLASPPVSPGPPTARAVSPPPSLPSSSRPPALPAGVKCGGARCVGQDPENMGCGGRFAATLSSARVGTTLVELRYSKTCGAAWARVTGALPGDTVRLVPRGGGELTSPVTTAVNTYTPMAAVPEGTGPGATGLRACTTSATGASGCTAAPKR
jgi:transcriptional regulator with XRE-family HTH domain